MIARLRPHLSRHTPAQATTLAAALFLILFTGCAL